jgi:membrane-bound inhibitor of C-type lysozyme
VDGLKALSATILAALWLAACKDPAPAGASHRAEPPAVQAPVNPDAGITHYACVDGEVIVAGYPDRETAVVTYKDHAYTLKLAPSASGARYTGYGLQWWTKGTHASIAPLKAGQDAADGPGLDCDAAPEPAAGETVTRTAYIPGR